MTVHSPVTMMMVDDNVDEIFLTRRQMQSQGFTNKFVAERKSENLIAALEEMAPVKVVGTAVDQAGALHWLIDSGNRCDIAIIDIFLRQGSGMGVLRALYAAEAPFERVVLTNYATADIRRQCLALGASAVFDKSGEIDALVDHCVARAARPA